MAFLERRKFSFFDLKESADGGKILEAVGTARVTACGSGYGLLVLGDSSGFIHLVYKTFEIKSFKAYNSSITLIHQCRHLPYLITIGEDTVGINPLIKIWSIEKFEKDSPLCMRVSRAAVPNAAVVPTCLTTTDSLSMMAIGFADGSILLYRGDIKKERTSKKTAIKEQLEGITGLALSTSGKSTHLYVTTTASVEMFDVTQKDKEKRTVLNNKIACDLRCSVLVDEEGDRHFFVATRKEVLCYTNGVLGPCFNVEGVKVQLHSFKGYLIVVAKNDVTNISSSTPFGVRGDYIRDNHVVTVIDIQNNITAFHAQVKYVSDVLIEWGSLFILSPDNNLSQVVEKDLQSKLALLFKKNSYDVAIRVAKYNNYDSDGLCDIFRQFGDHLYSKGDHKGAVKQYIKTIGKLEPSYVIRKYLGSQQVENLTTYLQALHKEGLATGAHTTLLLNFYTKLNKPELLKEFIMTKDREIDFDVEVAIDVCRHVSATDALMLAEKHAKHDWYLMIQLEDQREFAAALEYISKLDFDDAEYMMKKHGITLIENIPKETTQFLIRLCTDYKPSNEPLVDEAMLNGYTYSEPKRSPPENFIHYFLENPSSLVEFLEHLIQTSIKWSPHVYTTLLELYLQIWASSRESVLENKIMKLLESSDSQCDKLQALILCKANDFKSGLLFLYEHYKMYQAIMAYHVEHSDFSSLLCCCRRFEHQEPQLWVQALTIVIQRSDVRVEVLTEILNAIERRNILSPLAVVETLCSSECIQISVVKDYLRKVVDTREYVEEKARVDKYTEEIEALNASIDEFKTKPFVFQGSLCSICNKTLELPTVHFFCQHSFHVHCIQSFAENENECPPCQEINKQVIEAIKSQEENKDLDETFHSHLEDAEDGFSLVTDYLGRGVFTRMTSYTEVALRAAALKRKFDAPKTNAPAPSPVATWTTSREEFSPVESHKSRSSHQRARSPLRPEPREERNAAPPPKLKNPFAEESRNPFDDDDNEDEILGGEVAVKSDSKNPFFSESKNPFDEDED